MSARLSMLSKTATTAAVVLFCAVSLFFFAKVVEAATNILSTSGDRFAWNDVVGWIDFYGTNSVNVMPSKLTGYASSSMGDISLDCATTRAGDICATSNYGVINNGAGTLSGWGWNDSMGWISFSCVNHGCGGSTYGVYIDGTTGQFYNYAWNDVIGWISFNCYDAGLCGTSNYKVTTTWRATSTTGYVESTIFDTTTQGGSQINSFLWQGALPVNTEVRFQFASSNSSSGPWLYVGPDGTENTTYKPAPGVSTQVDYSYHNNKRYIRYKVTLVSDQAQKYTPRIDDIIINWSP